MTERLFWAAVITVLLIVLAATAVSGGPESTTYLQPGQRQQVRCVDAAVPEVIEASNTAVIYCPFPGE